MTKANQAELKYLDEVMDILESFGYEEYVEPFNTSQVAESISRAVYSSYIGGLSARMCALAIFGGTITYQVIPYHQKMRKH